MSAPVIDARRPITVEHFLTRPAYLRTRARIMRIQARRARRGLIGIPSALDHALADELERCAGIVETRAALEARLESRDRHTRARAQAEASGITDLLDALTANA